MFFFKLASLLILFLINSFYNLSLLSWEIDICKKTKQHLKITPQITIKISESSISPSSVTQWPYLIEIYLISLYKDLENMLNIWKTRPAPCSHGKKNPRSIV